MNTEFMTDPGGSESLPQPGFLGLSPARATSEMFSQPPPRDLELANGETHVFRAALDLPSSRLECLEETLSADERVRAGRFVFARDRKRFVAGRGILREILGRLLRAEPAHLIFACGEHGKPHLAAPVGGRVLHFNLAHSDALAVYVISAHSEVGIDVERIRPVREAGDIARHVFSAREYEEWRALPAARQTEAFFEYWTRKEALLKAVGTGLGGPLNQIEVSPPSGGDPRRPGSMMAAPDFSKFSLHSLTPVPNFKAAAATQSVSAPSCWRWPAR